MKRRKFLTLLGLAPIAFQIPSFFVHETLGDYCHYVNTSGMDLIKELHDQDISLVVNRLAEELAQRAAETTNQILENIPHV